MLICLHVLSDACDNGHASVFEEEGKEKYEYIISIMITCNLSINNLCMLNNLYNNMILNYNYQHEYKM